MGLLTQQSPVARAIADKIVRPALDSRAKDTLGTIVAYYPASNTADIDIFVNGQRMRQTGVKMPHNAGTIGRDPRPGDEVWVAFQGDNYRKPYVVMRFDSNYQYGTGLEQQTTQQALMPSYWGQI